MGGELSGDPATVITRPVEAGSNEPHGITFAEGAKYYERVRGSGVGAVIVPPDAPDLDGATIRVEAPRAAFSLLLHRAKQPLPIPPGIHPTAIVDGATIAPDANIGPYVVFAPGAVVESGASVHAFCYVGPRCVVGAGSVLYPHVVLVEDVVLGRGCTLFPGVVLGADGFGYVWTGSEHAAIPQVGGVRLADHVDIGANTTIDRATVGDTLLGTGVKVDNLVQIAHNVKIGPYTVIASQVGLAGSAQIGAGVLMGGQAAVADHATVGDRVILAGRSGVMKAVQEPGEYFGLPATPIREAMRQMALMRKLPDLLARLEALEKKSQT